LIAEREEEIKSQKLKIGALCAALLEKPEEKVKNLHVLLNMLEYRNKIGHVNYYPTRKLVMLSLAEIFKDLLPEYRVGIIDTKKQKGEYQISLKIIDIGRMNMEWAGGRDEPLSKRVSSENIFQYLEFFHEHECKLRPFEMIQC
jgi:Nucleolar complex-associated protein